MAVGTMLETYARELSDRSRRSGLVIGGAGLLVVPAWGAFDRLLQPAEAAAFIRLRLICELPIALGVWLLWRRPLGRRRPEAVAWAIMSVVQAEVAWMVVRADRNRDLYLLGFSLALYASGCLAGGRSRWTAALVGSTWLCFGGALLTEPHPLPGRDLAATGFYIGTASIIGVLSHAQRSRLAVQELATRARLEQEQHRTGELMASLARLSNEDALTGLGNRRRWDTELAAWCAESSRSGDPVAVILLDVDHFKDVNDRFGHGHGDDTLRRVGDLLREQARSVDVVARLGGDEFGVLVAGSVSDAADLAERLRQHGQTTQLLDVSFSLGVVGGAGSAADPDMLMSRADKQLYRAKATRNAVAADRSTPVH